MSIKLLPSVEAAASETLACVSKRRSVYVEGPVGSGRNSLFHELKSREPRAVALELLHGEESDAPAVALLEIAAQLGSDAWPKWVTGTESELHQLARSAGQRLADAGRALFIRIPDSWQHMEGERAAADAIPSRARSLLDGLLNATSAVVLVADAGLTPSRLGFHPSTRVQLPPHATTLRALDGLAWDEYADVFERLATSLPGTLRASPLAWRLAVGAHALGASTAELGRHVASPVPIHSLAKSIAGHLGSHQAVRAAVRRFMAIRRPLTRADARRLSGVPDEHAPLILECIGYGAEWTRVSTVLRTMLSHKLGRVSNDGHLAIGHHYAGFDGARSPIGLAEDPLRSWCEKAHHFALAGESGEVPWQQLDLVSPSMYWDRGRHLSLNLKKYKEAADVYERCVKAFPRDDYAWHYLGFNRERAGSAPKAVSVAYREAVRLNPEHPWWNGRLITHLIVYGDSSAAQAEWLAAVNRIDPDGTQVRASSWLAHQLHLWVSRAWLRTSRKERARSILELVPRRFRSHGPLRMLERRIESQSEHWARFLRALESRCNLDSSHAAQVRLWWTVLHEKQPDLPLPIADVTSDQDAFQFAWSYDSVLLEIDVSRDGGIYWFGQDRMSRTHEDGSFGKSDEVPHQLSSWLEKVASA